MPSTSEIIGLIEPRLEHEAHSARKRLVEALQEVWSRLSGNGMYHGSVNVQLTQKEYERDIEARQATFLEVVKEALASCRYEERQQARPELSRLANEWLGNHIAKSEKELRAHADRLGPRSGTLDLGRDRILRNIEAQLDLLAQKRIASVFSSESFVDPERLAQLRGVISPRFDLSRLIKICEELDLCFQNECYLAVGMLTRSLLDHVPPIFGVSNFSQVANNYGGSGSFKDIARGLETMNRKIADSFLHTQVRRSESSPTRIQVDVRSGLDAVLAEVVRILEDELAAL
jgi:hypothetical protein